MPEDLDDMSNAAFPNKYTPGMTLRDYFAGQALAGLCATDVYTTAKAAMMAYAHADAMLEERAK